MCINIFNNIVIQFLFYIMFIISVTSKSLSFQQKVIIQKYNYSATASGHSVW